MSCIAKKIVKWKKKGNKEGKENWYHRYFNAPIAYKLTSLTVVLCDCPRCENRTFSSTNHLIKNQKPKQDNSNRIEISSNSSSDTELYTDNSSDEQDESYEPDKDSDEEENIPTNEAMDWEKEVKEVKNYNNWIQNIKK